MKSVPSENMLALKIMTEKMNSKWEHVSIKILLKN
jgi:hypothetical protein